MVYFLLDFRVIVEEGEGFLLLSVHLFKRQLLSLELLQLPSEVNDLVLHLHDPSAVTGGLRRWTHPSRWKDCSSCFFKAAIRKLSCFAWTCS